MSGIKTHAVNGVIGKLDPKEREHPAGSPCRHACDHRPARESTWGCHEKGSSTALFRCHESGACAGSVGGCQPEVVGEGIRSNVHGFVSEREEKLCVGLGAVKCDSGWRCLFDRPARKLGTTVSEEIVKDGSGPMRFECEDRTSTRRYVIGTHGHSNVWHAEVGKHIERGMESADDSYGSEKLFSENVQGWDAATEQDAIGLIGMGLE